MKEKLKAIENEENVNVKETNNGGNIFNENEEVMCNNGNICIYNGENVSMA